MKCIYCNTEKNMTVSDVIPWALTGAKLRKKFVCHEHNAFTNDHYEKKMISDLAIFRNQLGLTERDGDSVRFSADLSIDGYIFKGTNISDKASIVDNKKRMFSTVNESGGKTFIGPKCNLLKMRGVTEDNIHSVDLSNVSISKKVNLNQLLISSEVLHTIAKIGYEWHCIINNIDGYDFTKYNDIVTYILNPECMNLPIELVTDAYVWALMDSVSQTGSNMLYEYDDSDGNTYVIFGLWGIIIYKIRICKCSTEKVSQESLNTAYLYHTDGTIQETKFGVLGNQHVIAESPQNGLARLCLIIKERLSKLDERDLSYNYFRKNVNKIKELIPGYKAGTCTLAKMMEYEDNDRLLTVYILELLWKKQSEYDKNESFEKNMYQVLNSDGHFIITENMKYEAFLRYIEMDKDGLFCAMLEEVVSFFEQIQNSIL